MSERIDVVSTHLDDAALSIGAWIHTKSRAGAKVRIVTAFAGDPHSEIAAGAWDARAGFKTEGEAAIARRIEDLSACRILGAEPIWLPFSDEQYREPDGKDVIDALEKTFRDTTRVLIPGYPLKHPDHRRIAALALASVPPHANVSLYLEQPYAAEVPPGAWTTELQDPLDIKAKREACRAYRSQLRLLGRRVPALSKIRRFEQRAGGESFLHVRAHSLLDD
ncbi:MAG: PIG-L deacetylase family protein [Actinomycetota bacterium]